MYFIETVSLCLFFTKLCYPLLYSNINQDNILTSNAALDAYFSKYRINPADREFDVIYINGDNNLENLRLDDEQWKVVLIETEFNKRMWEE